MTISKQLVEAMGGTIGVNSEFGAGSTFWFTLALEKQAQRSAENEDSLAPDLQPGLENVRVLGIDDNATNRRVLTKMVEGFGCRIETVPSGAKGLELLRSARQENDPFRIILLDMQMPEMDGEQTAREIKRDPSISDAQIIILTSMGQRGDAARLKALGCAAYLLKPVKQKMLHDTLRAVNARTETEQPHLVTRHSLSERKRQGLRILLAEDNPINQKLAVILLQKAGLSVVAVENGLHALEKVQNEHYNAVLMDVQMPEMDGFEATRRIRQWESGQGRHIPIIAMTAHALKGDRELCIEAGMDDYITKPLEPNVLFNTLDRWTQTAETSVDEQDYSGSTEKFAREMALVFEDGLFGEPGSSQPFVEETALPGEESPIDLATALPRFFDDIEFFREMCSDLISHMPDRMREINHALEIQDTRELVRQAHNLKGLAANFSAGPVSELAARIEALGKSDNFSSAAALTRLLEIEADRLSQYCIAELGVKKVQP